LRRKTGDQIADLVGDRTFFSHGPFNATNLRDPRPVELRGQTRAGLQMTGGGPSMRFRFGAMFC
jgi:hypothetical protein